MNQATDYYFVNLAMNGTYNTFYDVSCIQGFNLGGNQCTEAPTNTNAAWDLSNFPPPVSENTDIIQGGFNLTGSTLENM